MIEFWALFMKRVIDLLILVHVGLKHFIYSHYFLFKTCSFPSAAFLTFTRKAVTPLNEVKLPERSETRSDRCK